MCVCIIGRTSYIAININVHFIDLEAHDKIKRCMSVGFECGRRSVYVYGWYYMLLFK